MATTNLHTDYGVEILANDGPTGEFREAIEAALVDYGGNVLQRGKVGTWCSRHNKWRIPTHLVATKLGEPIASADVLCDWHDESL